MNILLTGGAGFIGSHLCKRLIDQGHSVICLDNFITGSKNNVKDLLENPHFKLIEHDISQSLYLDEQLDWVMHFASLASPKHYLNYPIKTLKSGLLGTHNCLGIAKKKKAKFLLASTSEIYGDPLIHPQTEEYWGNVNAVGVRGCYDESKRGAEALAYAYWRQHGLDIRVVRIFNTYGPNMDTDDGRVVSNFIVQAIKGEKLTIYGKGQQTRSFCYVDDLVKGILKMFETDYQMPVNLGNAQEFTINELAQTVLKLTNSEAAIEYLSLPEDDPKRRKPNTDKAKKLLNWQATTTLEQGLTKTIDYFKKVLNV